MLSASFSVSSREEGGGWRVGDEYTSRDGRTHLLVALWAYTYSRHQHQWDSVNIPTAFPRNCFVALPPLLSGNFVAAIYSSGTGEGREGRCGKGYNTFLVTRRSQVFRPTSAHTYIPINTKEGGKGVVVLVLGIRDAQLHDQSLDEPIPIMSCWPTACERTFQSAGSQSTLQSSNRARQHDHKPIKSPIE